MRRRGGGDGVGGRVAEAPTQVKAEAAQLPATREDTEADMSVNRVTAWWDSLESRYKVHILTSGAFMIANMDKINMSVAIIPMALDFGWSPSVSGVVQSAFFYGYLVCQLPSGWLSNRFGGRTMLPVGVGLWSLATAGVPLLASTVPGLCVSRALVGLGEAAAPAAAIDMVARVSPPEERSRAVSFIFAGLHVGSILGLLSGPLLIRELGWQSVFVVFGGLGLAWLVLFEAMVARMERSDPAVFESLTQVTGRQRSTAQVHADSLPDGLTAKQGAAAVEGGDTEVLAEVDESVAAEKRHPIPWRAFVRNSTVQALMFTHFANNWFHYTMLAWLPTYFTSTLEVDLMHAAQTALLPPIAGIAASAAAGPSADAALAAGVPLPLVRKTAQMIAFLVPSAILLAACTPAVASHPDLLVACITLSLGLSSFSLAGLYCTHQDLSPRYASAMLSLTNTVGAIPGIVGVMTVGLLYDWTSSWESALFIPSAGFMLTGAAVFAVVTRHDQVDFDAADNKPFSWEPKWPKLPL